MWDAYRVFVAYEGLEALKIARQEIPNSILLDIQLPNLGGFEIATSLRHSAVFSDIVIIGYSGHAGTNYFDRAREAGIDYYLPKPADPEVLLACLEPENHPTIVKESMIILTSKQLIARSTSLLTKCQALSSRSQEVVRRAQRETRRSLSGRTFLQNI